MPSVLFLLLRMAMAMDLPWPAPKNSLLPAAAAAAASRARGGGRKEWAWPSPSAAAAGCLLQDHELGRLRRLLRFRRQLRVHSFLLLLVVCQSSLVCSSVLVPIWSLYFSFKKSLLNLQPFGSYLFHPLIYKTMYSTNLLLKPCSFLHQTRDRVGEN